MRQRLQRKPIEGTLIMRAGLELRHHRERSGLGTKTSVTDMSWLPVPRIPMVFQVSLTWHCSRGK